MYFIVGVLGMINTSHYYILLSIFQTPTYTQCIVWCWIFAQSINQSINLSINKSVTINESYSIIDIQCVDCCRSTTWPNDKRLDVNACKFLNIALVPVCLCMLKFVRTLPGIAIYIYIYIYISFAVVMWSCGFHGTGLRFHLWRHCVACVHSCVFLVIIFTVPLSRAPCCRVFREIRHFDDVASSQRVVVVVCYWWVLLPLLGFSSRRWWWGISNYNR